MSESLTLWNNVCVLSRGDRINILAETHRTATRRRPEPNENRAQQVSHRQEPEEVFQFLLQFLILGQYQTSKVIYELWCLNSCHVFKLIINVSANFQTAAKKTKPQQRPEAELLYSTVSFKCVSLNFLCWISKSLICRLSLRDEHWRDPAAAWWNTAHTLPLMSQVTRWAEADSPGRLTGTSASSCSSRTPWEACGHKHRHVIVRIWTWWTDDEAEFLFSSWNI